MVIKIDISYLSFRLSHRHLRQLEGTNTIKRKFFHRRQDLGVHLDQLLQWVNQDDDDQKGI